MAHFLDGGDYAFVANVAREYASNENYANRPDCEVVPVSPWADFVSHVIVGVPYGMTIISEKCEVISAPLSELMPEGPHSEKLSLGRSERWGLGGDSR